MTKVTVVVIGSDKSAQIAAKRAQDTNPEARIVLIDPGSVETLTLDMDSRAVLFEDEEKTKRQKFDALVFTGGPNSTKAPFEKSARFLPEFSFEVSKRALQALTSCGQTPKTWQEQHQKEIPDLDLLLEAGAMTAKDETLVVDEYMCTSLSGVYACGKAVSLLKAVSANRQLVPSESMIERAAHVAGHNAASTKPIKMLPCAGTESVCIDNQYFARTGLSNSELNQLFKQGEYARATICEENAMMRLVASRASGAIVSGELVGDSELYANLNLVSVCVVKQLTAEDIISLDVHPLLREAAERIVSELANETQSISAERLALWVAQSRPFQCVDVSEKPSGIARFLKSAHLPLSDLERHAKSLVSEEPIVLSSQSGRSSVTAFKLLKKKLANKPLFYLEGGTKAAELIFEN